MMISFRLSVACLWSFVVFAVLRQVLGSGLWEAAAGFGLARAGGLTCNHVSISLRGHLYT